MITGIARQDKDDSQDDCWKRALSSAIRDPFALLKILNLDDEKYYDQLYLADKFTMLVPLSFVKRMKKGDWNDPLLKQVLSLKDEENKAVGFLSDPVGDKNSEISSGVLQKYHGRVLIITTGACAVHCRYCFRQHFPYADSLSDKNKWQQTLNAILEDETIHEVILSGGDPLMLSDERLNKMCTDLAEIPHVMTLRFHTRVPVILPERVTASFINNLKSLKIRWVMVLHVNHANELNNEVGSALKKLSKADVMLLNQSVLLKNINDDVKSLALLSQRLFDYGILPYYIHTMDKVQGAAHFEVSHSKAIVLQNELKGILPGYLVPKFVTEVSGKRSKQAIE